MVAKLVDPFDAPAKAPRAKVDNRGLVDPFDEATAALNVQGGTYETPTGRAPGTRQLMDTPEPLGFMQRFRSGLITDPQARLQYFAGQRFPNDPQAAQRYGYRNGEAIYVDDSGALYRENEGKSFIPGNFAPALAENLAPTVLGTMGGVIGGPPGAALGGAAGTAINRLGGLAEGDKQTSLGNAGAIAVEGILQAAGWKLGEVGGKKVLDRRLARDAAKWNRADTLRLQNAAREYGIDLTPAEASNLGSLISQQSQLGMGLDEAGDTIREFLERRAGQVDDAVTGVIGNPPPAATIGRAAREVGKQAVDDTVAARTAASRSLYRRVVRPDVLVPEPEMERLMSDDIVREAFDTASTDPTYGVLDAPANSMSKIDAAKKILDDKIAVARKAGNNNAARVMGDARGRLVSFADKQYPTYAEARKAFETASPAVEEMQAGIEGTLAGIKDSKLAGAARNIFRGENIGPREIAAVRRQFTSQGREADWDNVLNQFLRQNWESLKDPRTGASLNEGAAFRQKVFGTKNQRAIMREAMGPERYAGFEKLMDVLEATGRASRGQSQTQPFIEGAKAMRTEASPILGRDGVTPVLGDLKDWWVDRKVGAWRADLAKAITSPESVKALEDLGKLRGLSPTDKKVLSAVTTVLTKAGVYGPASLVAGQPPDAEPQLTQQQPRRSRP